MTSQQSIEDTTSRNHYRTLMSLRGAAFIGQLAAIFLTYYWLNIVLPVATMVGVAAVLAAFNVYCLYRLRLKAPIRTWELFLALCIDVLVLTVQFHFSNGANNPLVSFYMLPVIAGALMLTARLAWMIYGLTMLCYLALTVFAPTMPADMEMDYMVHSHGGMLVDRSNLHMSGMMIGYFLCAACVVAIVSRIRRDLGEREEELQASKAQALEQDHILRTGLLAAGAAHELGTPLTTLSIILKDWLELSPPRRKADRDAELATMAAQVDRCKSIISDILAASGRSRGEGASLLPLNTFIWQTADRWRDIQKAGLTTEFSEDSVPIVADRILEQALFNLLDNALEASRSNGKDLVSFSSQVENNVLRIDIGDAGLGFDASVLASPGQPFQSTKAASGRGLGLFLVKNTVQSLGGELQVKSTPNGSTVTLLLPLSALEARQGG